MKATAIWGGALLLLMGLAVPATAQDDALMEVPLEFEEIGGEQDLEYQEIPATYPVWWGNRSISYGNYLRFDRIDVDAVAPAPPGPREFDTLWFERDKAFLRPEARSVVDNAALHVRMNPDAVVIIEVRPGPVEMTTHRRTVAQQRVNAVRDYLIQSGVPADRIRTPAIGETVTAGPGDAIIPVSAM